MTSQTLHQREALAAVTRRRMRGIPPSAPTRNGALSAVPPPADKRTGAAGSSSPAAPVPHLAQVAGFVVVTLTWVILFYCLTIGLGITQ